MDQLQVINILYIINVDVSAELDGYYADTGASIVVGQLLQAKVLTPTGR